ncbi:MAG: GDP-mannose 4,6-dehydratase [Gemmatimonadetes bacterium]|nr:GDP-mannose 4,6-dehydratase [Gemmatimonadota bacterium]
MCYGCRSVLDRNGASPEVADRSRGRLDERGRRAADRDVDAVLNLAAESHVDRSIVSDAPFVRTNVTGTHVLFRRLWRPVRSGKGRDRQIV